MKLIGKLISKLYWKFGRKHDDSDFWNKVAVYHFRKSKIDGKYIVVEMNRITSQLEYRSEYTSYFIGNKE